MAVSFLNPFPTTTPALGHFFSSISRPRPSSVAATDAFLGRVTRRARRITRLSAGPLLSDKQQQSEQPDVSVLRFTLGIPGLDESYLPRYLGLAFGSLIILNHFLGSSGPPSAAQMRTEVLGLCLATFSTVLPYLGKFLKGAGSVDRSFIPEGNKQIFVMSEGLEDILKEDLAWGSYVLLRNTNTILYQFVMNYVYVAIGMCWKMLLSLKFLTGLRRPSKMLDYLIYVTPCIIPRAQTSIPASTAAGFLSWDFCWTSYQGLTRGLWLNAVYKWTLSV